MGRVVSLYMDTITELHEGDVLLREANPDSGRPARAYRIVELRRQLKGMHEGRWHTKSLVIDPATIDPTDDVVVTFVWYPRRRRRR